MKWYMPCKLGERYPETKFITWVNGTRVFGATGRQLQLIDIDVGMRAEWSATPEEHRTYGACNEGGTYQLESYCIGKWNFEHLILEISDAEFEERVLGKKKVRLLGVRYSENGLLGHYVTCDRYEHFYEPINIELRYLEVTDKQYFHFSFKEDKEAWKAQA